MGLICGSHSQGHENAAKDKKKDNTPFKRNNVIISFKKNVTEEYQDFNKMESLKFGKLVEETAEHILIDNKFFLVSDRDVDYEGKPLKESELFHSYWKANHLPLYGLAQPNTATLKKMLDMLLAHNNKPVLLFNLREEPVLILAVNQNAENTVSYSIRTKEQPSECVVVGLSEEEANDNELLLRKQVLKYAATNNNFEFPFYNCIEKEPKSYSVQYEDFLITSNEMYCRLKFEYPGIRYNRFCLPLYSASTEEQFDSFITFMTPHVFDVKQASSLPGIFIGKDKKDERCATAVVLCSLFYGNILGFPHEANNSGTKINLSKPIYEKGEFQVIRTLTSQLPDGLKRKHQVDVIIDMCCGDGINLRHNILQARNLYSKLRENNQIQESQVAAKKALEYLERYFYLICFNAYLAEQSNQGFCINFSEWMLKHPNLYRIQVQLNLFPKKGQELLKDCILIEDTFNQEDVSNSQQSLCVNFQKVSSHLSVYGMAQPSSKSVRKIMDHLMNGKSYSHVVFINLRNDISIEAQGKLFYMSNVSDANKQPVYFHDIESLLSMEALKTHFKFDRDDVNTSDELMTTRDIFKETESSYPNQIYCHIPLALNYVSNENIFDILLEILKTGSAVAKSLGGANKGMNRKSISVPHFNPAYCLFCSTGIERTSFAMAVVCLYMYQKSGFPTGALPGEEERISLYDAEHSMGNFPIVRCLVALLPDGYQVKREVDFVLDNLFEMMSTTHYHMREMILATYNLAVKSSDQETQSNMYRQSILLLERYIYLILFNCFLRLEKNSYQKTFQHWMVNNAQTTGIHSVLNNLHISKNNFGHIKMNTLRDRWRYIHEHRNGDIF